jgi:hypothetical protein
MTAATITPIGFGSLPSTEGVLSNTTVPSGEEWSMDLLLCNRTSGSVTYRIAVTDGTTVAYRSYDATLGANSSIDVFRGLKLPPTYKIQARAGAAASIDYIITAARRLTI